jgi:hypothetical protein
LTTIQQETRKSIDISEKHIQRNKNSSSYKKKMHHGVTVADTRNKLLEKEPSLNKDKKKNVSIIFTISDKY